MNKEVYLGFLDYEKAYDFSNRALFLKNIIQSGIGRNLAYAIAQSYINTSYVPKISNNMLGDEITTVHGFTQGRKSNRNFFSCYVSNISCIMPYDITNDFTDPHSLLQIADDTSIITENMDNLSVKFGKVFKYGKENYLYKNLDKTNYIHLSKDPSNEVLTVDEETVILPAKKEGYPYLGWMKHFH